MSLPSNTYSSETDSFAVFKQDGSHQFYCRWTTEEDRLLTKAVADHGPHKWTLVSKLIPGRTAVQCSTRWFGALNPNVHKGRWSKSEDKELTDAVNYFQSITPKTSSLPWNRIAENIPHRTGIQCQARWTEALDPAVRKGRWHPEEDKQLKVAIEKYGCCWIRVASMIPTRTQRQCRTRWNQIHSQQLKASSSKMVSNTRKTSCNKYEFMPPTFPNDASITIKQESDQEVYKNVVKSDSCIIISASPTMGYASPVSTRSSSSSFSCSSPTFSTLFLPASDNNKQLASFYPTMIDMPSIEFNALPKNTDYDNKLSMNNFVPESFWFDFA